MTSDFAPEVAKYPKSSPKPHNFRRLQAYCFAMLAMQLIIIKHSYKYSHFATLHFSDRQTDRLRDRWDSWQVYAISAYARYIDLERHAKN